MNIVFAYHSGDCELALESAKAIVAQGFNKKHKATICCVEGTPLVPQITKQLEEAFPEVGRIMAQSGFEGWPLGPNQMFSDAAIYCYQYEDPWYFWEPDCVPMVDGWVDKLDEEFKKYPNKIMGSLVEGGVAPSGKKVYQLIVGSAIYPAKFLNYCGLAANLCNYNIAYRNAGTVPEPWDVRCRWTFMDHGRNSDLIKAYWQSCNYHRVNGDIVFFAQNPEAQDIQSVTCPDRKVDPKAIVVHGCKDGSLHRMVYDKNPPPIYMEIEQPVVESVQYEPPKSSVRFVATDEKDLEKQKFLAELRAMSKTLGKSKKARKKKTQQCKTSS